MKRRLYLALVIRGVYLWMVSPRPVAVRSVDRLQCIAAGGWSVDWEKKAAPIASKPGPHFVRAGLLESLGVQWSLPVEHDLGPPWLVTRGPPGKVREASLIRTAAEQSGSPKQGVPLSRRIPRGSTGHHVRKVGFATAFR